MNEIKHGAGGGDGSTAQEVTGEPRAGGGASPGYRLRRCDEEHGTLFRVNRQTGSGPNKKSLTEDLFLRSSCGPRDLLVIKTGGHRPESTKIEMKRSL